jgi:hypothetical protein
MYDQMPEGCKALGNDYGKFKRLLPVLYPVQLAS